MSKNGNQKKTDLLGIHHGTASNRLRKNLLFHLVCKLEINKCFQCGLSIDSSEHLSIEHKNPWMKAENPVEAFYDLENIAFSHLRCNVIAAERPHKRCFSYEERRERTNELKRGYWNNLSKEEKQKLRRDNYIKNEKK